MGSMAKNLIGNALKFHWHDQPPQVRIYSRDGGDEKGVHEIFVEDNGIGFEEKYLDKIFLPLTILMPLLS
jgi:light-regulated signal transduction histidine kinase (bacteriophytochrome)